jgi:cytochrome c-type biogenesis protein CcmH
MRTGFFIALALLLTWSSANAIDSDATFDDPALLARYQHLTRELRCPKCQNETIADSDAPVAADLRRELRTLLTAGKSDEEIIKFLTDRYGDFLLYRPPFVARTWILWATPIVGLLAGLVIAAVVIRRRARLPIDADADQGTQAQ